MFFIFVYIFVYISVYIALLLNEHSQVKKRISLINNICLIALFAIKQRSSYNSFTIK